MPPNVLLRSVICLFQLKESTDFTHRRKIRGKIRKLREQMEGNIEEYL